MKIIVMSAICFLFLSGCATTEAQSEVVTNDYFSSGESYTSSAFSRSPNNTRINVDDNGIVTYNPPTLYGHEPEGHFELEIVKTGQFEGLDIVRFDYTEIGTLENYPQHVLTGYEGSNTFQQSVESAEEFVIIRVEHEENSSRSQNGLVLLSYNEEDTELQEIVESVKEEVSELSGTSNDRTHDILNKINAENGGYILNYR